MKNLLLRFTGALLLFLLFGNQLFSQGQSTTQGKEFWLSYGANYTNSAQADMLQLRVVAVKKTNVTITFTQDNTKETFTVDAGQVYTRTFNASEAAKVYSNTTGTTNKSLHIVSDELISVFAINIYRATTDATNVLPITNYGKAYHHMTYQTLGNSSGIGDGYTVVAIENNTSIKESGTVVATLNKGQVYSNYKPTGDRTGVLITSDKPIAYFTTNTCVNIPVGNTACDCLFQQQVPVHSWGNNFLVPVTRRGIERVRIVASQDGTQITQKGAQIVSGVGTGSLNLNAGQFVELEVALNKGGCYITANKPVAVASFLIGTSDGRLSHGLGDPAMAWVPPIEQTVMNVALAPFAATGTSILKEHHALIVTPTPTKGATTMTIGNGIPQALSGGTWTDNPDSKFSFYSIPLDNPKATYYFENAAGLSVMGYGLGEAESYFYLAASSARQLNPAFYINEIHFEDANGQTYCKGEFKIRGVAQMQLAPGDDALTWEIDGVEVPNTRSLKEWTTSSLSLDKPHTITMVVKSVYGETFRLNSIIKVVDPKPLKITGELYICPPATKTVLTTEPGATRYQWYKNGQEVLGATKQEHTVIKAEAGEYSVKGFYGTCESPMGEKVTVVDGCKATLKMNYNGNGNTGGTAPVEDQLYVENAKVTVKGKGDMVRTGATFIGWTFNKTNLITKLVDQPNNMLQEGNQFNIKVDTTLYAVWAIDVKGSGGKPGSDGTPDYLQHTVFYNGNDHTGGNVPTDATVYKDNQEVTIKAKGNMVRKDATFLGWRFVKTDLVTKQSDVPGDMKQANEKFNIVSDSTLYAVWAVDKRGPNGNGGDGVADYLQYGVTYKGNGNTAGTAPVDEALYDKNASVKVKAHGDLARTKAVFIGWSFTQKNNIVTQKSDEPTDLKQAAATFNIVNDTTLYAVWAIDEKGPNGNNPDGKPDYAQQGITYDGNGATGAAPVDPALYNKNDDITLKGQGELILTDAAFIGWTLVKKPGVIAKKSDVPTDLLRENAKVKATGAAMTFYAVWAVDKKGTGGTSGSDGKPDYLQRTVFYNGNEHTDGQVPTDATDYEDNQEVTIKGKGNMERKDAKFLGWRFTKTDLVTKLSDVPSDMKQANEKFTIVTDTTLYAVWAVDAKGPNGPGSDGVADYLQFAVKYDGNSQTSGTVPVDNALYDSGNTVTVKGYADLKRDGATIIGWSLTQKTEIVTAEPSDMKKVGDKFNITANTTLYAVWAKDVAGPNGPGGDGVADYLQFAVKYEGNGQTSGTAPVDNALYNSGDPVTLKDSADLKRTGATFIGWSFTQKTDIVTAKTDEPGDMKKVGEKFNIAANTTLYAVWAKDVTGPGGQPDGKPDYEQDGVKYFGNGNTGGTAPIDDNLYNKGSEVTVKGKGSLVYTDATFLGWTRAPKALIAKLIDAPDDSELVKAGSKFNFVQAESFHAVWAVDKKGSGGTPGSDNIPDYLQRTVKYDGNGGAPVPVDPTDYKDSQEATVLGKGTMTRQDATFIGWSFEQVTNIIATKAQHDALTLIPEGYKFKVVSDTTLYAVWAVDKKKGDGTTGSDNIPDYLQRTVKYDGNTSDGGQVPTDPTNYTDGQQATVKDKGTMSKLNAVFLGWTFEAKPLITAVSDEPTEATGLMKQGKTIVMMSDTTLYAVWAKDASGPNGNPDGVPDYKQKGVAYDGNLPHVTNVPVDNRLYKEGTSVTIKDRGQMALSNAVFLGWTLTPKPLITNKGSEPTADELKKPGSLFVMGESSVTFYAVWAQDNNGNGIPDYDEVEVIWHPGTQPRAGRLQKDTLAKDSKYLVSSKGFAIRGFVLVGWATQRLPVIRTLAAQYQIQPLFAVGDSIVVKPTGTQPTPPSLPTMTLYAVWAPDANNSGMPDYNETGAPPTRGAGLRRGTADEVVEQTTVLETPVRVWAYGKTLNIETGHAVDVKIYTLSGALYKQLQAAEGVTSEPLDAGAYVVAIEGERFKVFVR